MKKYLIFVLMAVAIAVTASCGKEKKDPGKEPVPTDGIDAEKVAAFILLQNEGVYDADLAPVLLFDPLQHELVYNVKSSRFIIRNDALEPLLTVDLQADGEDVYAVEVNGGAAVSSSNRMKLVKSQGDTAWLWDLDNNLGIIILKDN